MSRFIYNLFLPFGLLFFLPDLILKYRRRGGWKSTYRERFGFYGNRKAELKACRGAIWVHSVSVGETVVALSMIKQYLKRFPDKKFILSTTTTTGQDVARANCPENVKVIFCPIDFPWMVRRALRLIKPSALVIFETEIWPNLVSISADKGIPVMLVNGRMSDHSAAGYRKFSKIFFSSLLRKFSLIMTQTEVDAERYLSVSPLADVVVGGNMKFDQQIPQISDRNVLLDYFGGGDEPLVLFGASTHPGEEELLVKCFVELKKDFPNLKLVLVPRHAERADDVAQIIETNNLSYVRRSKSSAATGVEVLLGDTTGEMMLLLQGADVVVMGKSFAGHDEGHNLIEPALLGKAVVTGMVLRNFRYILKALVADSAILQANDAELCMTLRNLLESAKLREELGKRAFDAISAHRGATDRAIDALENLLSAEKDIRSKQNQ